MWTRRAERDFEGPVGQHHLNFQCLVKADPYAGAVAGRLSGGLIFTQRPNVVFLAADFNGALRPEGCQQVFIRELGVDVRDSARD